MRKQSTHMGTEITSPPSLLLRMWFVLIALGLLLAVSCESDALMDYERLIKQRNVIIDKISSLQDFKELPSNIEELERFTEIRENERAIWQEALLLIKNNNIQSEELRVIHQNLVDYHYKQIYALDNYMNNLNMENLKEKTREYLMETKRIQRLYEKYITEFKKYCVQLGYEQFDME